MGLVRSFWNPASTVAPVSNVDLTLYNSNAAHPVRRCGGDEEYLHSNVARLSLYCCHRGDKDPSSAMNMTTGARKLTDWLRIHIMRLNKWGLMTQDMERPGHCQHEHLHREAPYTLTQWLQGMKPEVATRTKRHTRTWFNLDDTISFL